MGLGLRSRRPLSREARPILVLLSRALGPSSLGDAMVPHMQTKAIGTVADACAVVGFALPSRIVRVLAVGTMLLI